MPDGNILTIYSDELIDMNLGRVTVDRASNVLFDEENQEWKIVIKTKNGEVTLADRFKKRADAIAFETALLNIILSSAPANEIVT